MAEEDGSGATTAIIIVVVVLLVVSWIISKVLVIVHQAEGVVVEKLGRFDRVLTPGINFVIPFLESQRSFTWNRTYIDSNNVVRDESISAVHIDLRESVFNFMRQEVYTKDTILLDVNTLMYYRITDIKKAVYEVDDLNSAIQNVAQTQLKEVFGAMNFSTALTAQDYINEHMVKAFGPQFARWGLKVERMELLDMRPQRGTADAMKKQMLAERNRRAEFIVAEGKKSAMRLRSEGTKIVKFQMGVAEQEATRKKSEGEAGSKVELAQAESKSLGIVSSAISADGASQSEYMIAERYMKLMGKMSRSTDSKTIYLPYEVAGISGLVKGLPSVYGVTATRDTEKSGKKSGSAKYADLN
jgi:regulator of protease activity HflC (stomatin/prohibitin superfamily)